MVPVRRNWLASLALGVSVVFSSACLSAAEPERLDKAAADAANPASESVSSVEDRELGGLVNEAISITSRRYLTANVHTPWQIMHGILALRSEFVIKLDGEKKSAFEWMTSGSKHKSLPMIERTEHGARFHTFTEPYAFEGHPNQFLAILTMSELPEDFSFTAGDGSGQVTIRDMINNAKADVNDREEITWTLWSLTRYLPVDAQWHNRFGEPWSIERLVQIQTYASVDDAACGGTHGLFALSLARNSYLATGQPLRGIWFEADQKIRRYVASAKSLQNSDGTFSSNYFAGPGHSSEFGKRLASTGHVLEFLMIGAQDSDMEQPWLKNAVRSVATDLIENRRSAADCGPLYHALHALVLYRQRVGIDPSDTAQPTPDIVQEKTPRIAAGTPEPKSTKVDSSASGNDESTEEKSTAAGTDDPVASPTKPETDESESSDSVSESNQAAADSEIKTVKEVDTETGDSAVVQDEVEVESDKPIESEAAQQDVEVADAGESQDFGDAVPKEAQEKFRSPEDNAYVVPSVPVVMDDGYEIPLPPTED